VLTGLYEVCNVLITTPTEELAMTIFDVTHGSIVTRTAELTGWKLAQREWSEDGESIEVEVYLSPESSVTVYYGQGDRLIRTRHQDDESDHDPESHDLLGLVTMWFHAGATI
jgi:hypothetical protein